MKNEANTVAEGMNRLEAMSAEFDYDIVLKYVYLLKDFLQGMKKVGVDWPFRDVCADLQVELPTNSAERLEAFLRRKPDDSSTPQKVCRWYLVDLHAMELGLKPESYSVYEPLVEMLELGGNFYEHNGAICIQDAATIPIVKG